MSRERSALRAARHDSFWVALSLGAFAIALASSLRGAFRCPPLDDYDVEGHAVNAFALYQGELPPVSSWCGFHPLLYHALAAALLHLMPTWVPAHVPMRSISILAAFAAAGLVWRTLRHLLPAADASVVVGLLVSVPGFLVASGMVGNEMLSAFLITAVLGRLVRLSPTEISVRHAATTGLLAGLAGATKITGMLVAGIATLAYAAQRDRMRRTLVASSIVAGVSGLVSAPHLVRMAVEATSPIPQLLGAPASGSPKQAIMALQPPGRRQLADYLILPPETLLRPDVEEPAVRNSVAGLLYASTWADAYGHLYRRDRPAALWLRRALLLLGLVPTLLGLWGAWKIARDPRLRARLAAPLAFGLLLLASFVSFTIAIPFYSAVKPSYLLGALLPAGLLVGFGLASLGDRTRAAARGVLVGTSLLVGASTFSSIAAGRGGPERRPLLPMAPPSDPRAVALAYFERLCGDPMGLLPLLAPEYHRRADLRLWIGDDAPPRASALSGRDRLGESQTALLFLLKAPLVSGIACQLRAEPLSVQEREERAVVLVKVRPHDGPPFVQRFSLRRDGPDEPWKIFGVEQKQRMLENALAAFVAAPRESERIALWSASRRPVRVPRAHQTPLGEAEPPSYTPAR